jgi:hypothetical protein
MFIQESCVVAVPCLAGLKMQPIFLKITKIRQDRSDPNLKITYIFEFKFRNFEKNKKYMKKLCKKVYQILRTLVEKFF